MKQVLVAVAVVLSGVNALACTYDMRGIQKHVLIEAADLVAVHMKARGFRSTQVEGQPQIESVESISTPMCPKELTHYIRLNVSTKRPTIGSPGAPCRGQLTIKVVAPFSGSEVDSVHYTVSGVKGLVCAQ